MARPDDAFVIDAQDGQLTFEFCAIFLRIATDERRAFDAFSVLQIGIRIAMRCNTLTALAFDRRRIVNFIDRACIIARTAIVDVCLRIDTSVIAYGLVRRARFATIRFEYEVVFAFFDDARSVVAIARFPAGDLSAIDSIAIADVIATRFVARF